MTNLQIRNARLLELGIISLWSRDAVKSDYGFYPPAVQRSIARRNSLRPLLKTLLSRSRAVIVAEYDGQLIGCLIGSPLLDGVAVVQWLYVVPAGRKQGAAQALLDRFEILAREAGAHKIMLWTEVAHGYYKKIGWTQEAVLPRHWWGQDFYIMTKYFDASPQEKAVGTALP